MVWPIIAGLSAIFDSLVGVFSKRVPKEVNDYLVSWSLLLFALPLIFPILLYFGVPTIGPQFWTALLISGSLNAVAINLYIKALKHSDLSIVVPILNFLPAFALITAPFILGEFPTLLGISGVLLIVIGAYVLNVSKAKDHYLNPLKALLKDRGAQYMLLVAGLWTITSMFDKVGVQNSSPYLWAVALNSFIVLAMLPILFLKVKDTVGQMSSNWKTLIPVGVVFGLVQVFYFTALTMTLVAYVLAIKYMSAVLSVIWGGLLFKEKNLKERFMGAVIMVAGALLILFA